MTGFTTSILAATILSHGKCAQPRLKIQGKDVQTRHAAEENGTKSVLPAKEMVGYHVTLRMCGLNPRNRASRQRVSGTLRPSAGCSEMLHLHACQLWDFAMTSL